MYCSACNEGLNSGEKFCRNCGERICSGSDVLLVLNNNYASKLRCGKVGSISFFDVVIAAIFLFLAAAIIIPNFRKARCYQSRERACNANVRLILGAVEMYNMDNTTMLRSIRTADCMKGGRLVEGRYLKGPVSLADKDCDFYNFNDLSDHGFVYCKKHGVGDIKRNEMLIKLKLINPENIQIRRKSFFERWFR